MGSVLWGSALGGVDIRRGSILGGVGIRRGSVLGGDRYNEGFGIWMRSVLGMGSVLGDFRQNDIPVGHTIIFIKWAIVIIGWQLVM